MTKTVLVVGGFGYLGGRICQYLHHERGLAVRVATKRHQDRIPEWASDVDVYSLDLQNSDSEAFSSAVDGADAIVHLAALNAHQSAADPVAAVSVNTGGTQKLVSAAVRHGVENFVYISTAHVYGAPLVGRIAESTLTSPAHPYAWTHRAAEDIVRGTQGLGQGIVLRLSNATGAPMDRFAECWDLAGPNFCRQAVVQNQLQISGNAATHRDFVPLADVVRAVDHAIRMTPEKISDGLFNFGSGQSMSIGSLARKIAEIYKKLEGAELTITGLDGEPGLAAEPLMYNCDKFAETGFSAEGSLDLELENTLKFCRENSDLG